MVEVKYLDRRRVDVVSFDKGEQGVHPVGAHVPGIKAREIAALRQVYDRVEAIHKPLAAQLPGRANDAAGHCVGAGILEAGRADELQHAVEGPIRLQGAAAIGNDRVKAGGGKGVALGFGAAAAAGKRHLRIGGMDEPGEGDADAAGCPAHQHVLIPGQVQILQRAKSSIKSLGNGGEGGPGQIGRDGDDLRVGEQAVFGIAAVESPAHLAHDGHDAPADGQMRCVRTFGDGADAFDAEDARERDAGGRAPAG